MKIQDKIINKKTGFYSEIIRIETIGKIDEVFISPIYFNKEMFNKHCKVNELKETDLNKLSKKDLLNYKVEVLK